MPLIRQQQRTDETEHEADLVKRLAQELTRETSPDEPIVQPLIFEQPLRGDALHVIVAWERWRAIPASRRSSVIMKAYETAAADRVDKITIAMGVTTHEAIELNLLPYQIEPAIKKNDEISDEKVWRLMKNEGAVETAHGLILAFPDITSAKKAMDRLVAKSSPDYWSVVKSMPAE